MADYSNILGGLRVQTQIPLDVKEYSMSEMNLSNLGLGDNLAYTYTQGLVVYCVQEGTRWEWRQVQVGEENTGLISTDFQYPPSVRIFDIDYSDRIFNFFPYLIEGQVGPQGPRGFQGIQGIQGIQGVAGNIGPAGTNGTNGVDGTNGLSAYEIAVSEGFVGDEASWLLSLQGPTGIQGEPGPQGLSGSKLFKTQILNSNFAPVDVKEVMNTALMIPANLVETGDLINIKVVIETFDKTSALEPASICVVLNATNTPVLIGDSVPSDAELLKVQYLGTENIKFKLINLEYNIIKDSDTSLYITGSCFINNVDPIIITPAFNDFYEGTETVRLARRYINPTYTTFDQDLYFSISGYEGGVGLDTNIRSFTVELKNKTI